MAAAEVEVTANPDSVRQQTRNPAAALASG